MKKFGEIMFSMFLSLLLLFSTVAGTSRVYANESNKVYPITSEIANNFAEMSEIAAKSYDVKDEGNISIAGEYSTLSNINLLFNNNNEFIGYTETLIYNNPKTNKFQIDNYQNGILLEHKETSIDFMSNEKIKEGIQGLKEIKNQTYTRSVGSTVACLGALLGINGAVAYIIAGTCTTACSAAPVTGAVCAACIGGICAIGAGDIAGIVACFKS